MFLSLFFYISVNITHPSALTKNQGIILHSSLLTPLDPLAMLLALSLKYILNPATILHLSHQYSPRCLISQLPPPFLRDSWTYVRIFVRSNHVSDGNSLKPPASPKYQVTCLSLGCEILDEAHLPLHLFCS